MFWNCVLRLNARVIPIWSIECDSNTSFRLLFGDSPTPRSFCCKAIILHRKFVMGQHSSEIAKYILGIFIMNVLLIHTYDVTNIASGFWQSRTVTRKLKLSKFTPFLYWYVKSKILKGLWSVRPPPWQCIFWIKDWSLTVSQLH